MAKAIYDGGMPAGFPPFYFEPRMNTDKHGCKI